MRKKETVSEHSDKCRPTHRAPSTTTTFFLGFDEKERADTRALEERAVREKPFIAAILTERER